MEFYRTLNANKKKKKYKNMQFLGRTEFEWSVMAVERHKHDTR